VVGLPELLIGVYNTESSGNNGTGMARLYLNTGERSLDTTPLAEVEGQTNGDNLGEAVALAGAGQVVSYAAQDDSLGVNLGRPYWFTTLPLEEQVEGESAYLTEALPFPGDVGGTRFGVSLTLGRDPSAPQGGGERAPVLAVGAPYSPRADSYSTRAGSAKLYRHQQDRFELAQSVEGHEGHTAYDLFGEGAREIGDFDGDGYIDLAIASRADERPNTFAPTIEVDPACPSAGSQTGAVFIFSGADVTGDQLVSPEPRFVIYGGVNRDEVFELAGAVDLNGDGRDDLIVGGRLSDEAGRDAGVASIYWGEASPAQGVTRAICASALRLTGHEENANLGRAVTGVRDLNGDGCDEALIGEPRATVEGAQRQGSAHLIYGWGGDGCFQQPWLTSFSVGAREDRFGFDVASAQLDGLGADELVLSGFNASVGGERRGALWVVKGEWVTSLPRRALGSALVVHNLNAYFGAESAWWMAGEQNLERFGWQVKALDGLILVSAPYWGRIDVSRAGQARLFEVEEAGINPTPVGVFQGELQNPDAQLGDQVDLIEVMGRVWVAVGSQYGLGNYATAGSVYTGWMTSP